MMGHKICFYGGIWLIIPKLSLLPLLIRSQASVEVSCEFLRDLQTKPYHVLRLLQEAKLLKISKELI